MKIKIIAILFILSAVYVSADDFRNYKWGTAISKVKNNEEGLMISESEKKLVFKDRLSESECKVYFYFQNESLYAGMYVFESAHGSANLMGLDYDHFNIVLSEKYGEPVSNETSQIEEILLHVEDDFGYYFETGPFISKSSWNNGISTVEQMLFRRHFKLYHVIYYGENYAINKIVLENMEALRKQL